VFDGVSGWWDGFELWLAQQWFPLQFVLVMAVLLPLCAGLAWLIHRAVYMVAPRPRRRRESAAGEGDDTRGGRS
jgi:hypothetical protein